MIERQETNKLWSPKAGYNQYTTPTLNSKINRFEDLCQLQKYPSPREYPKRYHLADKEHHLSNVG